mmetsp:Transcript_4538/g.10939  ORF Transcript_4538/g.10939 Transcript_4538/m.10939 type:complete len:328 (+) Transcript_4538:115-1098(+)|eukprot:683103-Rhodomonas_salina.2
MIHIAGGLELLLSGEAVPQLLCEIVREPSEAHGKQPFPHHQDVAAPVLELHDRAAVPRRRLEPVLCDKREPVVDLARMHAVLAMERLGTLALERAVAAERRRRAHRLYAPALARQRDPERKLAARHVGVPRAFEPDQLREARGNQVADRDAQDLRAVRPKVTAPQALQPPRLVEGRVGVERRSRATVGCCLLGHSLPESATSRCRTVVSTILHVVVAAARSMHVHALATATHALATCRHWAMRDACVKRRALVRDARVAPVPTLNKLEEKRAGRALGVELHFGARILWGRTCEAKKLSGRQLLVLRHHTHLTASTNSKPEGLMHRKI